MPQEVTLKGKEESKEIPREAKDTKRGTRKDTQEEDTKDLDTRRGRGLRQLRREEATEESQDTREDGKEEAKVASYQSPNASATYVEVRGT